MCFLGRKWIIDIGHAMEAMLAVILKQYAPRWGEPNH